MDTEEIEGKFIEMFGNNPLEFMTMCLKYSDENGHLPSFCKYVQLILNFRINNDLSDLEQVEKQMFEEKYGEIDVECLLSYQLSKPTAESLYEEIKGNSTQIYNNVRIAHEKNPLAGHAGFLEYCKSIKNNVIFAKGDIKNKGAKFNLEIRRELSDCIRGFNGKDYRLTENIIIKLKAGGLVHILVGHVKPFLVPRKGELIQFTFIKSFEELIFLIDRIILQLEEELIAHFSKGNSKFSKVGFQFEGLKYGIHISIKKEIKTFYEITDANK